MGLFSTIRRFFFYDRKAVAPPVQAKYAAAQDTTDMKYHWAQADALDADAANSLAVRKKIRERARLEIANNPYGKGIINTHTNYVIGCGPKLRMQTGSEGFNRMIESAWIKWCKATKFSQKLRSMYTAKTGDGEGLAQLVVNPAVRDQVKLDVVPFECDRLTAPLMVMPDEHYIDGVWFDEFGNPTKYDILRRHPGAAWFSVSVPQEYDTIDASFIIHWFRVDRPGQHRGVSEIAPALNLFGQARRYREAVIAAAETAADISAMVNMGETNEGNDTVVPFTTIPIEKRMLMMTPAGGEVSQLKAEQPATTYEMFDRRIICEEGRVLNMPYNIAACDSSGYSFSGGRLDHLTYYVFVDAERSEAEANAVDRVFSAWFAMATVAYQWVGDANSPPKHQWDWAAMPQIQPKDTATARKTALSFGGTRLGLIYAEDGLDFEDEVKAMSEEFGVTVEEMKARLLECALPKNSQPANAVDSNDDDSHDGKPDDDPPQKTNGKPRFSMVGAN